MIEFNTTNEYYRAQSPSVGIVKTISLNAAHIYEVVDAIAFADGDAAFDLKIYFADAGGNETYILRSKFLSGGYPYIGTGRCGPVTGQVSLIYEVLVSAGAVDHIMSCILKDRWEA